MKKLPCLFLFVFLLFKQGHSQSCISAYMPGYQISGFHAEDVRYNNSQRGSFHGKINHATWKFDGVGGNIIYGLDVTAILHDLISKKESFYGAGFDLRLGYAATIGESKLGAAIDVGYHGIKYVSDSIRMDNYNYYVMGITAVGLFNVGEVIYIMPKLSFDPIFSDHTDKVVDGLSTKFEVAAGFRFAGHFGFSITPGFERMKFNYEDQSNNTEQIKASFIKTKYLQFGVSLMFD